MNTFLETVSTTKIDENITGRLSIAVKLSELKNANIDFVDILNQTSNEILIDAEFERLDHWLLKQIEQKKFSNHQIQRLLITVQARRLDADDQLKNLQNLGIRVVLVAGNLNYIENGIKDKEPVLKKMSLLWNSYDVIRYIGSSFNSFHLLKEKYHLRISESEIIELYGNHSIPFSAVWVFYSANIGSKEYSQFVIRRNLTTNDSIDRYLITDWGKIRSLSMNRTVFVYLDFST